MPLQFKVRRICYTCTFHISRFFDASVLNTVQYTVFIVVIANINMAKYIKMFNANNIDIVKACQKYFSFDLPSIVLSRRLKILSLA